METRKIHETRYSAIPSDYAKLVNDVFTTNFDAGLKALEKATRAKFHFSATGRIYANEIVLCISLIEEKQLAATSVYASCDFDSKASSPTIEDLLSAGVDAAGGIFGELLDPANAAGIESVLTRTLAALQNVPLEWTLVPAERYRVWIRVDKANPDLERQAEDWLRQNDPEQQAQMEQDELATRELFVTGPKKNTGGTIH
jgi:hypothetical protein